MGFYQLPAPAKGLLRMSPNPHGGTLCEFFPLGLVPTTMLRTSEEHYVWWESDHGQAVVTASPYLRSIREVQRPFTVVLDTNGEAVA